MNCNHGGCRTPPRFAVRIVECDGAVEERWGGVDSFCAIVTSDTWHACPHHLGSIIRRLADIHPRPDGFPAEAIVEVIP